MSILTNIDVYWSIAEEAHGTMKAGLAESKTPKSNGEAGYIKRLDPDQRSFKNALIAIAIVGIYVDALLYILLQDRLGRAEALKVDRLPYQKRLERLGLIDSGLLDRFTAFRKMRNDLVHEKAIDVADSGTQPLHMAEDAADSGISLMQELRQRLLPDDSFKPIRVHGPA